MPYIGIVKTMRYKHPAYTTQKFLNVPRLQQESIKRIANDVDAECALFCKKNASILSNTKSRYSNFNWDPLLEELESDAPMLIAVLKAASKYSMTLLQ